MTRLTPLLLAVALLGCRDTSELEVDALQGEIAELTARLEALEADAVGDDTVLADFQATADATAADIADLQAEVDALSTVDLTETLAAIDDVDARIDTLEESGLATETWVETQAYMTQEAGEILDVRISANADAADSNAGLIASNTSGLSTQLTSILANAGAASTNAQALSSLDGRVTVAEAAAGQAQTDATRIDAALLTLTGDVSDLDDGVDALDDAVDTLSDRVDTAEAAVGGTAEQFTALADADSALADADSALADADGALQASIDELADQAQSAALDVSANRSSITTNTQGLTQAMGAHSALASDISANTDLIAGVAGDVSFNLELIESNLTGIEANTSAIGVNSSAIADNVFGVELALDTVADLELQVAASSGEVDDILARLDLVEVYTDTKWVTANTTSGADTGAIGPMQMDFTKQLADSILYVEYDDNLRANGNGQACRWEIYFNGQPCSSPGRVAGDIYVSAQNSHKQHGVNGYCRGNSGGDFGARDVAVSVRVSSSPGYNSDCYTGWQGDQLGVLRVTEAIDEG
jgi:predicted  nucleic acid-binding Zn-ribbon protein